MIWDALKTWTTTRPLQLSDVENPMRAWFDIAVGGAVNVMVGSDRTAMAWVEMLVITSTAIIPRSEAHDVRNQDAISVITYESVCFV